MGERYQAPPGPPPHHVHFGKPQANLATNNPSRHCLQGPQHPEAPAADQVSADGQQSDLKQVQSEDYLAPPGPPPSHAKLEPPPYDPWLAVPDNALLPPPPALREERSPAANASYDDAARGHAWCRVNPLWKPQRHSQQTLAKSQAGQIQLTSPPSCQHVSIDSSFPGHTHVRTTKRCNDTVLLSDVPLYIPHATASPLPQSNTIYFELRVIRMGSTGEGDAGIAIGFLAPPYPSWRLPGWHRASLGVHGDDGRRYVDDSYGGRDFVNPFRPGDVVGLGMEFASKIAVFLTRNGQREAGWDLHEEKDSEVEEGDVHGLEGQHDLLAAVGVFGDVEFEVCFEKSGCMFRA